MFLFLIIIIFCYDLFFQRCNVTNHKKPEMFTNSVPSVTSYKLRWFGHIAGKRVGNINCICLKSTRAVSRNILSVLELVLFHPIGNRLSVFTKSVLSVTNCKWALFFHFFWECFIMKMICLFAGEKKSVCAGLTWDALFLFICALFKLLLAVLH